MLLHNLLARKFVWFGLVGEFCHIFVALICKEALVDLCQKRYDVMLCDNEQCRNMSLYQYKSANTEFAVFGYLPD